MKNNREKIKKLKKQSNILLISIMDRKKKKTEKRGAL